MKTRQLFQSMQGRRRSSSSPLSAIFSAEAPQSTYYNGCTKNNYLHTTLPKSRTNNRAAVTIANSTSTHPSSPHSGYSRSKKNYTRLLSSFKQSESSPSPSSSMTAGTNEINKHDSNLSSSSPSSSLLSPITKITTAADKPTIIDNELAQLRAEISSLSYLIKQSSSQQEETQALARRAEARAYIIEHKLMDIQSHVVKIPALENLAHNLREYLKERSPTYVRDAISRATEYSERTRY
jgi:hypothetical protein